MAKPTARRTVRVAAITAGCLGSLWCFPLPAQQPAGAAGQDTGGKIVVSVNKVLVPVVVCDGQGHAVGGLTRDHFQILDEGQPRAISGFSIDQRQLPGQADHSAATVVTANGAAVRAGPPRFVVFLFDDLHLGAEDLGRLQKSGERILAESLGPADVAAVVSVSGTNSGLTGDRGKLLETMTKLRAQGIARSMVRECPNLDYTQADLIENKRDSNALETATQDALSCAHLDPKTMRDVAQRLAHSAASIALAVGEQDVRSTLDVVREFVRRTAALKGERVLIFLSPGFPTVTAEATRETSQVIDLAAQSGVTISTLDARGVYLTELAASERGASSSRDLMIWDRAPRQIGKP